MAVVCYDFFRQISREQCNNCVCLEGIFSLLDSVVSSCTGETRDEVERALARLACLGGEACGRDLVSLTGLFLDRRVETHAGLRSSSCRVMVRVPLRDEPESAAHILNDAFKKHVRPADKSWLNLGESATHSDVILASVVQYTVPWKDVFDSHMTRPDHFIGLDGNILADFMYREGSYRYGEIPDCKILEIALKVVDYSMLVFLPRYTKTLHGLVQNLHPEFVSRSRANLNGQLVKVYMPKFKLTTSVDLKSPMTSIGIERLFTKAEFGALTKDVMSGISAVQKISFEVNENDNVDVSDECRIAVDASDSTAGEKRPVFKADRPFLFIILFGDTPIFIGKLLRPDLSRRQKKPADQPKGKRRRKVRCDIS